MRARDKIVGQWAVVISLRIKAAAIDDGVGRLVEHQPLELQLRQPKRVARHLGEGGGVGEA